MASDILYTLMMLVFLPILIVQARFMLYKAREQKRDEDRRPLETLLEELPHDLAIIGMTLGFTSFAITRLSTQKEVLRTLFLVLPFFPFYLMSALPLIERKQLRMALGLLAYFVGVGTFLIAQHLGRL